MELKYLPLSKLKPDKNQPRKLFNTKKIKEMAQSMIGEGVVVPIEIDEKNVIICGEVRWRAAKIAGLKVIPCVINTDKLSPINRLLRQCIENAHHSDMSVMDAAHAWQKLILGLGGPKRASNDKGQRWLARQLGVNADRVHKTLRMLGESKQIQTLVNKPETAYLHSYFFHASEVKDKALGEKVRKKIFKGEFGNRDEVRLAKREITKHPKKAQEILDCFP